MAGMEKLDDMDLLNVAGGVTGGSRGSEEPVWKWVMANVTEGYVALRTAPVNDFSNEVSRLVNGTAFQIRPDKTDGDYVYAYFNGQEGWINIKNVTGFTMHGQPY